MFASCQKEDIEPAGTGYDLVFTATIDNSATKTTINTDGNDAANRGKVSWEDDDVITITDAANTSVKYEVSSIDATTGKATFTKKEGETGTLGAGPYTAIYGSGPLTAQTYSADVTDLPMEAPIRLTGNEEGYTANSIFLPAAGDGLGSEFLAGSRCGTYWSSTEMDNSSANTLGFNLSDNIRSYVGSASRQFGCSVRPVRSSQ